MNSKDTKSSRELKREVLQDLNEVNNDMNRIQGRLTPGQLIDDALFQPIGQNPRAIFDHLKANPIGTAFLGLGTLLLMEDDSGGTYEGHIRKRSSSLYENTRYQATLLKGRVSDVNRDVNQKVSGVNEKIHGVIDRTKSKVDGLKDKFSKSDQAFTSGATGESDLGEGGELGSSSIDELKDNFGDVKGNITGKFEDSVSTLKNLDPMTYVALGAGLGALTGIALPVSDREQLMIDQKASGKLSEFSSQFQDALNQSVKVLKDEFLGKFTDFDVNLFGNKSRTNETFNSGEQT
jgi:hypothetical protein